MREPDRLGPVGARNSGTFASWRGCRRIERQADVIVPEDLHKIARSPSVSNRWRLDGSPRESRRARPRAGRARDLPAPSTPGCSSRSACRSHHPRSRPSPRPETQSSRVHHRQQRCKTRWRQRRGDRHAPTVRQRDIDPGIPRGLNRVRCWGRRGVLRNQRPSASSVPSRYIRRQVNSRDREISYRRAVADPCRCPRRLSSTIRILFSSDQCRRRPTSSAAKTSIGVKTEEHDIRPCLAPIHAVSTDGSRRMLAEESAAGGF